MLSPILTTERLTLRRLELTDAPVIQRLAGAREVAATTLNIPHPYPAGVAEEFIERAQQDMDEGGSYTFAIARQSNGALIGLIGLHPNIHHAAEMGYWMGVPFWGQGYATEAAGRVIRFGFEELDLNRIFAAYFAANIASGRVMQKAGMTCEGTMRQHILKWGEYHDVVYYSILREEFKV